MHKVESNRPRLLFTPALSKRNRSAFKNASAPLSATDISAAPGTYFLASVSQQGEWTGRVISNTHEIHKYVPLLGSFPNLDSNSLLSFTMAVKQI